MTPAEQARAAARSILAGGRFHQPGVPRPFAGVLRWIGGALASVEHAIATVADRAPLALVALGALAVAGLALLARAQVVRRVRRVHTAAAAGGPGAPGPRELEQAAAVAEAAGDYAAAVRLRFRAGLAELAARGALARPATMRGEQIGRRLRSQAFDELNATFEAVAYGGRLAQADDASRARAAWDRVVRDARP